MNNKIKTNDFKKSLALMSTVELLNSLHDLKKQHFHLRMQVGLKDTSCFSYLRSNVARILTIIKQKKSN